MNEINRISVDIPAWNNNHFDIQCTIDYESYRNGFYRKTAIIRDNTANTTMTIDEYNDEKYHKKIQDQIYAILHRARMNDCRSILSRSIECNIPDIISNLRQQKDFGTILSGYFANNKESTEQLLLSILTHNDYPYKIPNSLDLEYDSNSRYLTIDIQLPTIDQIPSVDVVESSNGTRIKQLSKSSAKELYESIIHQMLFRCVYMSFTSDTRSYISTITTNGFVTSIDPANGNSFTACICSLQVSRDDFSRINFSKIDPKVCFRALKGISSGNLTSITPVAPISTICRSDKRFIQPKHVIDNMNSETNIAAMAWEDFEHLIRDLFEDEFKAGGGEVKVTQASRDGGVDAIAFDPDPIRGGKIIIQAKRYTNTVSVSAVRDLYGALLNEGASKGIIVTTSDYGPDSYEFAKGKPLTLLNGANLLFLLEKHGRKGTINLKEAMLMRDKSVSTKQQDQ